MVKLTFLGAMNSVGASGAVVETETEKILLDYGTKIQENPPTFPLPVDGRPNAVLLSHAHLDHSGGLAMFPKTPIYATEVSKPLVELLLHDSLKISREEGVHLPFAKDDVEKAIRNFKSVNYHTTFNVGETEVTCFDAGHISGSMMPLLNFGKKTLLYTGDMNTRDTRLIKGSEKKLPKTDILITESTYSDREHPDRKNQEKQLVEIIRETLAVDGICLIAGFAISRIQELLLILGKYGIDYPLFIDGMAKKATTIINKHKNLLKEPNRLDKVLEKVQYISSPNRRNKIVKQPCVILSTSGMLNGGPIIHYIKKLYDMRTCSLVLTGYQVEGSPGKVLLETGRFITKDLNLDMKMFVKRLDFSSHAGRSDLFEFIERVNPEKIFCVHGDHTEEFANELKQKGFDAIAPVANNRIFIS